MSDQSSNVVLIDDNIWVREHWQKKLKTWGRKIDVFPSYQDHMQQKFSNRSIVFIDRFLQSNVDGWDIAKIFYSNGFRSIYITTSLATGSKLENPFYICGTVDKNPPEWLMPDAIKYDYNLTEQQKNHLFCLMTASEKMIFERRMTQFYSGQFEHDYKLPSLVQKAWESGIYLSLSDEELKIRIEKAWMLS